jgi:type II secretory pathway pseudopilin PulG
MTMSTRRKRSSSTAGFSLVEALVALTIASLLAVVLTRFVSGLRANAQKVREEVTLELATEDLLEHLSAGNLSPGRIDGRSGRLAWYIDSKPIAFSANAEVIREKKSAGQGSGQPAIAGTNSVSNDDQSNSAASSPIASALLPLADLMASAARANPPAKQSHINWSAYRVLVVVKAPSGRSYTLDTIRIVPQRPEPSKSAQEQH